MSNDRYTHGHHESVLRSHLWRTAENSASFLLPHLRGGQALLDVGCGPGTITADLARFVGAGPVIGIDAAAMIIDRARGMYAPHEHPNVSFEVGDVYSLRFPDHTFDVVFAHQVLQHLSDPVSALREMARVVRDDGLIAVREADFRAFAWSPDDGVLDEWLTTYLLVTRSNSANADAGRRLKGWALAAGLTNVEVSSSNWTFSSDEDRLWWGELWADRVLESDFARQAVDEGIATTNDLRRYADAFRRWATSPDAVFIVVNGEILARPGERLTSVG